MFIKGRVTAFFSLAFIAVAVFYYIVKIRGGMKYPLRRLAALNAIDEAIGTATELGKPVFFSTGDGDIVASEGTQVLAGLDILAYASEKCANYNVKIIAATSKPNVHTVTEEVVRNAYATAGRGDTFQADSVQFLSDQQMAYCAASLDLMRKEKVAAAILVGPWFRPGLIIADGAAELGAITIAGTGRMSQLPLFVASCDYCLLGEEMYAGSAYLTGNPTSVATIAGQDAAKLFAFGLIVVGSLLATIKVDFLSELIKR